MFLGREVEAAVELVDIDCIDGSREYRPLPVKNE